MALFFRIAFISQEFPPETGGGGIGTYLEQVTSWLAAEGHSVDVFCGAGKTPGFTFRPNGIGVHHISGETAAEFRSAVVPVFAAAHRARPFDVIEGNDFDAPALTIKRSFPKIPCVVKLHTPRFLIDQLHQHPLTSWQRWRMNFGALRRGRRLVVNRPLIEQGYAQDEIAMLEVADEIAAPSQAIADAALGWTASVANKMSVFPYPYVPSAQLLALPVENNSRRITFVGRLEERKGVIDLADAIAPVIAACPEARFRFVGRAMLSPDEGLDMQEFLQRRLSRSEKSVEFTGPVPSTELARYLGDTEILVAPSHWESFGLVCCEGMAAARPVIGSASGGMAEILGKGKYGVLVPPRNPSVLAQAIIGLLREPNRRHQLGEEGRKHVIERYAWRRVLPAQIASYRRAIAHCQSTGQSRSS